MSLKILGALVGLALLAGCGGPASTSDSGGAGAGTAGGSGAGGPGGAGTASRAAPGSQEDLVQSAGDRVLYETDSSQLTDQARATLDRQAAWLQTYPRVTVLVAGNCDERGTSEYNLALGQRRAIVARDYLVARGVASARLRSISYGKDRPTALGSDPQSLAQNRNAITSVQ